MMLRHVVAQLLSFEELKRTARDEAESPKTRSCPAGWRRPLHYTFQSALYIELQSRTPLIYLLNENSCWLPSIEGTLQQEFWQEEHFCCPGAWT